MPIFPTLTECYTTQQMTDVFLGYNHNLKIGDGEFYDMQNLTSSFYPLMANRGKRGKLSTLTEPRGLLAKSKLAYIDGSSLFYGDEDLTSYITASGYAISESESMQPKKLISMGAYIVIFPDRLYIDTENYTDCGCIDHAFSTAQDSPVSYTLCKVDGTDYEQTNIGASEPANPINGTLWIDTSGPVHALKQFNTNTSMWTQIPTVYTKITYAGIGAGFSKYDGVTISGCAVSGAANVKQIAALNGSKIIYEKGDDYIVVIGLIDQACTQTEGSVTVSRRAPDMDFVTESENRLWGCKYGLVNGVTVNEIYACALGDFKNWNQFLGVSTDSYAASVGTDGAWTGAVTHLGYPLFFKENALHKVYISSTGAHQIVDTACRGVQKGCQDSLVVVNEALYYKSAIDICVYDGSLPKSVSSQFGIERYYDAVAGAFGEKYYVSLRDSKNIWHLYVYDTGKGFWHHEDNTHALAFARCNGELYYIDADSKALMCVSGSAGDPEEAVRWSATTGMIGYNAVGKKYVSRFNFRMKLPKNSEADFYIQYDSDGIWHHAGHILGAGTKTFMLPVRPRRCDHFQFRIDGVGDVRLYSIAKIYEAGSDE